MTAAPHLLDRALRMAVVAHDGQLRKEGNIPYVTHPVAIALMLAKRGFSDEVVAAALVHDVPEDTSVSLGELRAELGDAVADMVASLTNDDALGWEDKKRKYIETVRAGSEGAKAVAVADKIHNAESLIAAHEAQGPGVWSHFNAGREKKLWFEGAMLAMLRESWNDPLVDEYAGLVERMNALA